MTASRLTAAEFERLNTWALEVAAALLPDVQWRDEDDERRFLGNGGLFVNRNNGKWYSHTAFQGSRFTLELIRHLQPEWSHAEAIAWAVAFLAAHPGTGQCTDSAEGEAAESASRDDAERVLQDMGPIDGTLAEAYLLSRGLGNSCPDCVRYLADARVGEGALIGVLTAHDRTVGVQLLYLDPDGRKSLVQPQRRRFMLEKAPGAVFIVHSDGRGPLHIAEGLEDALAVAIVADGPVWGLPGVSGLAKLEIAKGAEVIVVRDGDEPGSAADRALSRGVDHLLLGGVSVRVTDTPPGEDANAILESSDSFDALIALIAEAVPAKLSLDGEVQRLAHLELPDYDRERVDVAKRHKIRRSTLDDLVETVRQQLKASHGQPEAEIEDDPPWDGPIDLCATLDAALAQAGRYIVAPQTRLAAMVLWSTHTHLVHNARVGLQRSPRLALQSRGPGCGKTTALEIIAGLSHRGSVRSSATASTILRTIPSVKRTYCLDEADRQLNDKNSDLIAILDCGDRRSTAVVERSVPTPDGGWRVESFDVWGAVAFAGIDELPGTLQDRSIRIFLQRATGDEVPEHLRDGTSVELVNIRRQLAAWADGLFDLPDPDLPEVLRRQAGRVGDCWRPLIAIADLAGARWPNLARQAALDEIAAERQQSESERLLGSIRNAFDAQSESDDKWRADPSRKDERPDDEDDWPDNRDRLQTKTLLAALIADEAEEWGRANHRGREISEYWLRTKLRGLLDPAGSQRWETQPDPKNPEKRHHHRGYLRLQFETTWRRYLSSIFTPPKASAASAASDAAARGTEAKSEKSAENSHFGGSGPAVDGAADGAADGGVTGTANSQFWADDSHFAADESDAADAADVCEGEDTRDKEPAKPNGEFTTNGSNNPASRSSLPELIRQAAADNPDRSVEWLATQLGQPITVLRRVLGDDRS